MRDRLHHREPSTASGAYRTPRGTQVDITLADLSRGGCRVDDPHCGLNLGTLISLFIAETGPVMAEVAWRQGARVGLEFAKPLPESVFALLCESDWKSAKAAFDDTSKHGHVLRFCC